MPRLEKMRDDEIPDADVDAAFRLFGAAFGELPDHKRGALNPRQFALLVVEAVDGLSEREERILKLHSGFEVGGVRTLQQIANGFNLSRERIRQIEARGLRKLRHPNRRQRLLDYVEQHTSLCVRQLPDTPRHHRGGQISYLLLTEGQADSHNLAITWVEGEPCSEQERHAHADLEQVYVIIAGRGLMHVGDEEEEVEPGALVFVPKGAPHSIRNVGNQKLVYVSATSPPFDAKLIAALYEPPPKETSDAPQLG
jgi:mannose-6-phosphate isomerase-like protein (cupin superfamily)